MWRWLLCGLTGCLPSSSSPAGPARERDVLVEVSPGGLLIYRDGDADWDLVPRAGDSYGFDVSGDRFAIAWLDVEGKRVASVHTTLAEQRDFIWYAEPTVAPTHLVSGTISGLGELGGIGGAVAGRFNSQHVENVEAPQPFALEVAEGAQAVVFGRIENLEAGNLTLNELIVRRDVPVAADLEQRVDFATDGLPTQISTVVVRPSVSGCRFSSLFSFGETNLELATMPIVVAPHEEQWRAGDHLTWTATCVKPDDVVRTVSRDVTALALVPKDIQLPDELYSAHLTIFDGNFYFAWTAATEPVRYYEATVGSETCTACGAHWRARVTEGWIAAGPSSELYALSPPDLRRFGVPEELLALPSEIPWSLLAVGGDDATRFSTGRQSVLVQP